MRTLRTIRNTMTAGAARVIEGAYLGSDRELYYVEHVGTDRVLLENCRTGALMDASLSEAKQLLPVSNSRDGSGESTDDPATDDPRSKDVGDQLPEERHEEVVQGDAPPKKSKLPPAVALRAGGT